MKRELDTEVERKTEWWVQRPLITLLTRLIWQRKNIVREWFLIDVTNFSSIVMKGNKKRRLGNFNPEMITFHW